MRKHLLKSVAAAMAVAMAVPSVPLHLQAAVKLSGSESEYVLSKGDKLNLDIDSEKEKSGKYKTSKEAVVSVTKKGILTAKKTGNAKVTWKKGSKKHTCKIKVVKAPVLSKSKLELKTKDKKEVSVKKFGNKALKVKWSSSDKKIAKVKNGKITGISKGSAVIKAKIKGYKKTWTRKVKVTVKEEDNKATATPAATKTPATPAPSVTTAPGTVVPSVTTAPGTAATPAPSSQPTASPAASSQPTASPAVSSQPTASPASTKAPEPTPMRTYYPYYYSSSSSSTSTSPVDATHKGYTLKWEEQFDGDCLNLDDWNVEEHAPGWVNNELQAYVDSPENIYIKDGNLVLKPVKTVDKDGKVSYTSGRINTQNKHNFKYGLFEARLKFPEGQGFLPAFWMMPVNENLYGQWPRCGEIDIVEVLGNKTDTSYGTIHYGNPHSESQGKYTLTKGNFSDEYHVLSAEWEPGKINWYVDGVLAHTESDWYSATEGQGEITYPAPFDQPFYIILNLAVGGNWPGNPDETTDIENAAFMVDYVKVYQKDSYNEDVEKPEKEVILRDPDADGNYVSNGSFEIKEDLTDDKDWKFLTAYGGEATAEIKDKEIFIKTTNAGNADYSVQLVQPGIPMKKGGKYKIKFDAYADEERTMKIGVSAPDRGYKRYFADTPVELTTVKKTYEYEFTMTDNDDANARLEYNLGLAGSIAGVHISNVSIKKTYQMTEDELNKKTVRADGNYIYNGGFQEGKDRKGYWEITNDAGAEISVTNTDNIRKLKVVMPEDASADKPVLVSQTGIELPDNPYQLSFKAEGEASNKISVTVAGNTFEAELTGEEKEYAYKFNTGTAAGKSIDTLHTYRTASAATTNTDIVFKFEKPGTYYLDDIRLVEDSLIKNGSFNAGLTGYEVYVEGSANATCVVDSIIEDNAADFTINNTGDADWKIQLKQNNIELEKDQCYKLSLKAKSDMARKLMFAIQRDGSGDDNWTPYSGTQVVELGSSYQTYEVTFQMKDETDLKSILSISMGAVSGTQITKKHRICIDDISLEKIDASAVATPTPVPAGVNLLKNPDFSKEKEDWEGTAIAPGVADISFKDKQAKYDIKNVGTEDYHVQLKQAKITLEKGSKYKITFKAHSTAARTIKCAMLTEAYDWYGGDNIALEKGIEKNVVIDFTVDKDTASDITMAISMGQIKDDKTKEPIDTPASIITLSDFSLVKVDGEKPAEPATPTQTPVSTGENMLKNGDFSKGEENWKDATTSPGEATPSFNNNKVVYNITNVGTEEYHVQLKQAGITLEKGSKYKMTFKANSTAARTIKWALLGQADEYKWYSGEDIELSENTEKTIDKEFTIDKDILETDKNGNISLIISMGKIENINTPISTITLSDFSLVKVESVTPTGENMLKNGDFSKGEENWKDATTSPGEATPSFDNNKVVYNITNVGTEEYHVQLKQVGIMLEKGSKYKMTFKANSTAARTIKWALLGQADEYEWYSGEDIELSENTEKTIDKEFTIDKDILDKDKGNISFVISMGQMFNGNGENKQKINTPASTITLSDFSLVKVTE